MLSNPTLTFGRLLICVFLAAFLLKGLWCKFLFEVDCTPLFVHYFSLDVNMFRQRSAHFQCVLKKYLKKHNFSKSTNTFVLFRSFVT